MQADVQGQVDVVGHFRANLSLGAAPTQGSGASLAGSFISREHWLGYGMSDDRFLLRVGRINLPFGVRSIEHTLWVRRATRTDLNDTQQHGVALAFDGSGLRAEVMAIAGNYQIRPDAYRERGYSLTAEYAVADRLALGVSSLVTHAARDLVLKVPNTRQAHGIFARYAPWQLLALLGEGDVLVQHTPGSATWLWLCDDAPGRRRAASRPPLHAHRRDLHARQAGAVVRRLAGRRLVLRSPRRPARRCHAPQRDLRARPCPGDSRHGPSARLSVRPAMLPQRLPTRLLLPLASRHLSNKKSRK